MKFIFAIKIFLLSVLTACTQYSLPVLSSSLQLVMPDTEITLGSVEIYDVEALSVLAQDSKISIRGKGYTWVEGPLWIDDGQYLLFSDIPNNIIRKYDPLLGESIYLEGAGGTLSREQYKDAGSNGLILNSQKQLIIMQHGDRQVAVMNASLNNPKAEYSTVVSTFNGVVLNSPNDGVFSKNDTLYFTDPPYGLGGNIQRASELGFNGIYKLSATGEISLLDKQVTFPNGVGISPDNKTLYVAVSDPNNPLWLAYTLDNKENVSHKRVFYQLEKSTKGNSHGLPDGMVVHSSGLIFATGPEGVWLFNPQGKVLAKIKTGQLTSNCTLTTNEEYLFITADDYLLSVPLIY